MAHVTVRQGQLCGQITTDDGFEYYEFLGIPYAKPPVGDLRFKSPQDPEPWFGVRDATTVGSVACQINIMGDNVVSGSEDCLYLNVYTSKAPSSSNKLPVMVSIHGGGFVGGAGSVPEFGTPEYLLKQDVVVVTFNYRLSFFGFLCLDIPEAAGNMGLKDQVKAFQWVQDNIELFGGDKNNVTIFGISAGGASVEYQLISPLAKGLFHKGIVQSGSSINPWAINYDIKEYAFKLARKMGYKGAENNRRDVYTFFMEQSSEKILEHLINFHKCVDNRLFFGFVPTVEKDFNNGESFITEKPYTIIKNGKFNRLPHIRGFCDKEGYAFATMMPQVVERLVKEQQFLRPWSYKMEERDIIRLNEKFKSSYKNSLDDDDDKSVIDFFSDHDFISGIWLIGKAMSKHDIPVYMYQFSYSGNINFVKMLMNINKPGAAHGDDVSYLMKSPSAVKASAKDMQISERLVSMWTNFARLGDPTPRTSDLIPVKWPLLTTEKLNYLDINNELSLRTDFEPARMEIFEQILEKYGK